MKLVWKNPKSYHSNEFSLGNNSVIVTGWYTIGEPETPLSGGGFTAPTSPSFEIEDVLLVIPQQNGTTIKFPITTLVNDLNSISFRKDASNDLLDHFAKLMIKYCEN